MSAQKMQLMRSAHYVLTMDKESMSKKTPGYMGKLRSNLVGSEFNVFDKGENPSFEGSPIYVRNQHCGIIYVYYII